MITKVYINSALLRLYEPCAEPSKLGSSSNLAMSASNIESHIHVTARLSSIALTNWFNNWMSIPLSSYPFLTSALAGQFVYAFTMLGRWSNLYTKPDIKDIAPSLIIKVSPVRIILVIVACILFSGLMCSCSLYFLSSKKKTANDSILGTG